MIVKINNEEVSFYNLSTVETIDKTLDYGMLELKNTKSTVYNIGDYVEIIDDNQNSMFFIIEADNKLRLNSTLYKHTLNLIELTKKLESYTETRRDFKQPLDGQLDTLYDVVLSIVETLPLSFSDEYEVDRLFYIDAETQAILEAVESPDFTWDGKNMREMLNDVFSFIFGIPRLTIVNGEFVLTGDFYNNLKTLQDDDNFFELEQVQINNYATVIDFETANQIGNVIHDPSESGFRNVVSDTGILDTDTSYIKTFPIYEVTGLVTKVSFRVTNTALSLDVAYDNMELDLTYKIFEKEEFDLLQTEPTIGTSYDKDYKANSLYYTRYQQNIVGLFESYGFWFATTTRINNVVMDALVKFVATTYSMDYTTAFGSIKEPVNYYKLEEQINYKNLKMRVSYKPIFTSRNAVVKTEIADARREISLYAGQADRVVSYSRAMSQMFSNVQQMANGQVQTSSRDISLSLGDYTSDGYILITKETFHSPNNSTAKYLWSKNYQQINEYIGMNSALRLFPIPLEATKRNVLYNEYIEFSLTPSKNNSLLSGDAVGTYLNTFEQTPLAADDKPIIGVAFKNIDDVIKVYSPVIPYGAENTISFYHEFENQKSAGLQKTIESNASTFMDFIPYTNDDGTLDSYSLQYLYEVTVDSSELPIIADGEFLSDINVNERYLKVNKRPSEVIAHTYSLQNVPSISNSGVFVIGEYLASSNNLIKSADLTSNKFELVQLDNYINWADNMYVEGTVVTGNYYSLSRYTYRDTVIGKLDLMYAITGSAWAIRVKDTHELVLGVNQKSGTIQTVYLNPKRRRTGVLYEYGKPITSTELTPYNIIAEYTPDPLTFGATSTIDYSWDLYGDYDYFDIIIYKNGELVIETTSSDLSYSQIDAETTSSYDFYIRAVLGEIEGELTHFRVSGLPPAPTDLTVTPDANSILFDWADGGSSDSYEYKIISYDADYSDSGTSTTTVKNFTGLPSRSEYVISVRAVVGGVYSAWVSITTSTGDGIPAEVTYLTVTIDGQNTATLEWGALPYAYKYKVQWSTDGVIWSGDYITTYYYINTHTYTDLVAGTGYYFRVAGIDDYYGIGDWLSTFPTKYYTEELPSTASPAITIQEIGWNYVKFYLTNTYNESGYANVWYDIDDLSPDYDYETLASYASSNLLMFGSLSGETNHILYAYAVETDGEHSNSVRVSVPFTTLPQPQTAQPSIYISEIKSSSVSFSVTNSYAASASATVYWSIYLGTSLQYSGNVTLDKGSTSAIITKSPLTADTSYTLQAYAVISGEAQSETLITDFKTADSYVSQPIITITGKTESSISFTITQPYGTGESVVVYYELDDATPDLYSFGLAAGAVSSEYTISGLETLDAHILYARSVGTTSSENSPLESYAFELQALGIPTYPSGLSAVATYFGGGLYEIALTWTDNSVSEGNFVIMKEYTTANAGIWSTVKVVPKNTESYTFFETSGVGTVTIKVYATNNWGWSTASTDSVTI